MFVLYHEKKCSTNIYIGLENQILRSFFMENNIHYRHVIYIYNVIVEYMCLQIHAIHIGV